MRDCGKSTARMARRGSEDFKYSRSLFFFFFFFRALFLTLKGKIVANLAEIQPKVEGIFIEPNITPWL